MFKSSFSGKNSFFLLAVSFLILSSCSKKDDSGNSVTPTPVDYSKYPWIAYRASHQDTIQIKNNHLYMSLAPRDFGSPNTISISSLSRLLPATGDFELSFDYEKVSNFFLTLIANNQKEKDATISINDFSSNIGWGESYELSNSFDFETSTSGTITVKRTGQSLKVTIVKNYISNSLPEQKTQEATCTNFFDGATSITFSSVPFSSTSTGFTMTRFALSDNTKSIIDNFSSSDSLYVQRAY